MGKKKSKSNIEVNTVVDVNNDINNVINLNNNIVKVKQKETYKLYKLINEDGLEYYGVTTMKLNKRLRTHMINSTRKKYKNLSCSSRILFKNNKFVHIELIDIFDNKLLAHLNEAYCIRDNACVNVSLPIGEIVSKILQDFSNKGYTFDVEYK